MTSCGTHCKYKTLFSPLWLKPKVWVQGAVSLHPALGTWNSLSLVLSRQLVAISLESLNPNLEPHGFKKNLEMDLQLLAGLFESREVVGCQIFHHYSLEITVLFFCL